MKRFLISLTIILLPLILSAQALNTFQWKNRVLLVFTPSPQEALFQRQVALLEASEEEMVERRLVTIFIEKSGKFENTGLFVRQSRAQWYYDQFDILPHQMATILIGLDGDSKIRYINEVVEPEVLFKVIDTMPMRRNELRLRTNGTAVEGVEDGVRKY